MIPRDPEHRMNLEENCIKIPPNIKRKKQTQIINLIPENRKKSYKHSQTIQTKKKKKWNDF